MYFVFVDESGNPGEPKQNNEYFTMAGVVVHDSQILDMEKAIVRNKTNHGLSRDEEIKWNTKYGKVGLSLDDFISYRENLYEIINEYASTIVGTVIYKTEAYKKSYINNPEDVYKNSLFYMMERIHYYLEDDAEPEPTVFVLDSRKNNKNKKLDKMLARAYRRALGQGTYYTDFIHFSRNVFFSDSEDSIGIQLADHCAGPIYRVVAEDKTDWYDLIKHKVRSKDGQKIGYGIKIFPKK
jgi:hypothetical protein